LLVPELAAGAAGLVAPRLVACDLDAGLAAELGVGGRAVRQVLASAVDAAGWAGIEATVQYDAAPFGVEYLVADGRPVS
jgi:hypothetical protein